MRGSLRASLLTSTLTRSISHSLAMDVLWAALFGFVYRMRQGSWRGAGMVMGLVLSHWVLDAVSPDQRSRLRRVFLSMWA
jgi:membrane-bound metal-dependent hydrolase YbcI (DUF457 family)